MECPLISLQKDLALSPTPYLFAGAKGLRPLLLLPYYDRAVIASCGNVLAIGRVTDDVNGLLVAVLDFVKDLDAGRVAHLGIERE